MSNAKNRKMMELILQVSFQSEREFCNSLHFTRCELGDQYILLIVTIKIHFVNKSIVKKKTSVSFPLEIVRKKENELKWERESQKILLAW